MNNAEHGRDAHATKTMATTTTQPATRPAAEPEPRLLPPPTPPKRGAKPDPDAAIVGPDGFRLFRPLIMQHDREMVFARFSPCGRFLFAGSYDGRVYRWSLEDGALTTLAGHGGWLQGLAFHPDGKRMITGSSWGELIAWNYADETPKPLWRADDCHARWMRSLALSPDGKTIATCGADKALRLWQADPVKATDAFAIGEDLLACHFASDGRLYVGDLKGQVREFDLKTERLLARTLDASILYSRPVVSGFKEINDVGGVRCLATDPAGKWLVACGTQPATSGFLTGKPTAVCFDLATGKPLHTWQWEKADPSEGFLYDATWHPGGYFLFAASGQPGKGGVVGFRPGEDKPVYLNRNFAHARTIHVHPDGKRVALVQVLLKPGEGAGNGRKVNKDGEYVGLISYTKLFDTTQQT
jgi:WD40 repeat protein